MADLGGLASGFAGLASGFLQGAQAARQRTLDTLHQQNEQRKMAMQEKLAQSLEAQRIEMLKDKDLDRARLEQKDLQAQYEKPFNIMLQGPQGHELAADLAPALLMGPEYARSAPEGRGVYESNAEAALKEAAAKAASIRQQGYEHDISKIQEREGARANKSIADHEARVRDSIRRAIGSQLTRGYQLPEGVTVEDAVDNVMSGAPDVGKQPTAPMNRGENETLAAIKTVEDQLLEMKRLKEGGGGIGAPANGKPVDTGPVSGRWNRVLAMINKGNSALNQLDAASIRNKFAEVKAQSGAQYGMKELEQLSRMVPDNTVNDQEWMDRWNQAWRFHESRKNALMAGLKSSHKTMPGTGQMPAGFVPNQ